MERGQLLKTMKMYVSSIRKSYIFAGLVFILMVIIATIITSNIKHLMFTVVGWILIILGIYIGKLTTERISTVIKGSKLYDNHPLVARILKGMIFGCIFSIVVLLPFHYLYTTYFDSIHDEFLVADSDTPWIELLYYFLSWLVYGYDTPPEATHQTPALSYFLPTIIAWTMVGGILAYLKMKLKNEL